MNTESKVGGHREERGDRERRETNLICEVQVNMNEVEEDEIQLLV